MKNLGIFLVAMCVITAPAFSGDRPANSDVALEDSFDRSEMGEGWNANTGDWKITDGVLRAREIASQKHSAAMRRTLETQNAVYELKFRFVDDGKSFHFGFDPAPGELKKKGHLFSVMMTPESWKVLKHVDKSKPEEDPNETLAEEPINLKNGEWYSLRVTTWENHVTAQIEGKPPLKVSHPTFGVKKPTLVFRCLGDGVEVDDLRVWTQHKN